MTLTSSLIFFNICWKYILDLRIKIFLIKCLWNIFRPVKYFPYNVLVNTALNLCLSPPVRSLTAEKRNEQFFIFQEITVTTWHWPQLRSHWSGPARARPLIGWWQCRKWEAMIKPRWYWYEIVYREFPPIGRTACERERERGGGGNIRKMRWRAFV